MVRAALVESLVQKRVTLREHDGQGGFPAVLDPIATVRGRISSGSVSERVRGGRAEAFYQSTLFLAPGTDVARDDVFVRPDGSEFKVVAVRSLSGRRPHVECAVEEVRSGK